MKKEPTFWANIYLGLREGYGNKVHDITEIHSFIQIYCNENKIGVTVTPTTFFYVDGYDDGVIIGLINYPRYPMPKMKIITIAQNLGKELLKKFNQERLSIVFPNETIMLEKNN
jgi:hypothetical protein